MRVSRREILKGMAPTTLLPLAGCTFLPGGNSDGNGGDGDGENTSDQSDGELKGGGDGNGDGNESDGELKPDEEAQDTDENGVENTSDGNESGGANESGNESEQERQSSPSEEDLEIDRDKYTESSQRKETEDRPSSDVEIVDDAVNVSRAGDGSGDIIVEGGVKNVSDDDIDLVDIEIHYYDQHQSQIGTDVTYVEGVPAGEEAGFTSRTGPGALNGEVANVGFTLFPQDYVDG